MLIHRALPLCLLLVCGFIGFIGFKLWQDPEAMQKELFFEASNQLVSDGTSLQAIDRQILEVQTQIDQERAKKQAGEIHQFFDFEARQKLLTANVATAISLSQVSNGLFAHSHKVQANTDDAFYANIILNSVYTSLSKQSEQLETYNTGNDRLDEPEVMLENTVQALKLQQAKQIESITKLQQLKIEQSDEVTTSDEDDTSSEQATQKADEILSQNRDETAFQTTNNPVSDDQVTDTQDDDVLSDQEMQAKPSGKFLAMFPNEAGQLRKPAEGSLYHNPSGGLIIKTADRATVVAPYDGVIEFVGNFRELGPMIILSHASKDEAQKNHSILYGLDSLIVAKGLPVLKGEPLGFMGTEKDKKTNLFFELQIDTLRVDPLAWLE